MCVTLSLNVKPFCHNALSSFNCRRITFRCSICRNIAFAFCSVSALLMKWLPCYRKISIVVLFMKQEILYLLPPVISICFPDGGCNHSQCLFPAQVKFRRDTFTKLSLLKTSANVEFQVTFTV